MTIPVLTSTLNDSLHGQFSRCVQGSGKNVPVMPIPNSSKRLQSKKDMTTATVLLQLLVASAH